MRISVICLSGLLTMSVADAQTETQSTSPAPAATQAKVTEQPVSKSDTVSVSVESVAGKNQVRLDVFVVNSEPVAGMPLPFKIWAKDAKLRFDSVSYSGGRVEYFQLKTQNADTANQTILFGLIADLSGTKPPLAPGRGKALSVYYSSASPLIASSVKVEPVILLPANKLEFNILEADGSVGSTIPTFVKAKPAAAPAEKKP